MGGSSGGSSSGAVSYPSYMQDQHELWLDDVDALITAASNPFTSATAYDPDTALANSATALTVYNDIVTSLDYDSDWGDLWTIAQNKLEGAVFSDTIIAEKVAAYSASVLARLSNDILPSFKRGLQNVRAVMTSAFTIGEALTNADAQRDINKYEADLKRDNEQSKLKLITHSTDSMLNALAQEVGAKQSLAATTAEVNRIKIVAKQEENQRNITYDEKEELWDFELLVFAGNVLASISGAASTTTGKEVSTAQSVLGGALSGAAAGAMLGPVGGLSGAAVGGIGAVLGGLGGLL